VWTFARILTFCNASCGTAENYGGGGDDDESEEEGDRIAENSYFWISLKTTPTEQTVSHSEQFV